jgi:type I restriction enzyme, S subunit
MTFPAYSQYKVSGIESLGEIPSHWDVTRLPYVIFENNAGEVIDKNFWGDGSELLYTCAKQPLLSDYKDFPARKRTGANDLLLTRNGTPYVHLPSQGAIYSNVVQRVSLIPGVDRKFMRSALDVATRDLVGYGVSIASFNYEMWAALRIPLPDYDEQTQIARFLDHETARIDALIEEQQRLIELLKEKRQAVISHSVTKGLDPTVPMKDSGVEWLGEVPAHWDVGTLRWYATIQGGVAKGKDYEGRETVVMPYLRVANVQNGYVDLTEVKEIAVLESEVERYRLRAGDVLMNEGGDNDKLGRGTVWQAQIDPCLHQNHVFAIRPNGLLRAEWLAAFTQSEQARTYFYLNSKQSTNLASISASNVMSLALPIPSASEQLEILTYLEKDRIRYEQLTGVAVSTVELLQERRSALISAAVTGKIDVRGWQPPASAPAPKPAVAEAV